jgi:hypothetical protein
MQRPQAFEAGFTFPFSFPDLLPTIFVLLGIGGALLLVLVLCGIFGLCWKEKRHSSS